MTTTAKRDPNALRSLDGRMPSKPASSLARFATVQVPANRLANASRTQPVSTRVVATTLVPTAACPARALFVALPPKRHESPRFARD